MGIAERIDHSADRAIHQRAVVNRYLVKVLVHVIPRFPENRNVWFPIRWRATIRWRGKDKELEAGCKTAEKGPTHQNDCDGCHDDDTKNSANHRFTSSKSRKPA